MSRGLEVSRAELEAKGYRWIDDEWRLPIASDYELHELKDENGGPIFTVKASARHGFAPNGRAYRSKWERDRAAYLDMIQRAGEIRSWQYEALTLLIGHDVRYTPDFLIVEKDRQLTVEEVKGYWRDDAKVKFRVAAMAHPYLEFHAVTKTEGRWRTVETLNA